MLKQRTLATALWLSLLFSPILGAAPLHATLEQADWQLKSRRTSCQLTHQIPGWGQVVIGATAQNNLAAYWQDASAMADPHATLYQQPPPWRSGQAQLISQVQRDTRDRYRLNRSQTESMLGALQRGDQLTLLLTHLGQPQPVSALPVGFQEVASDFYRCFNALPARIVKPKPKPKRVARANTRDGYGAPSTSAAQRPQEEIALPKWEAREQRSVLFLQETPDALGNDNEKTAYDFLADYLMAPKTARIELSGGVTEGRAAVIQDYFREQGLDLGVVKVRPTRSAEDPEVIMRILR